MKPRTVTLDDGRTLRLAKPAELGPVPCTGEAHSNPYIDHCGLCLPRWGDMVSFAPINPEVCIEGVAVAVCDSNYEAFEAMDGRYRMVGATLRQKGSTSHFYVWVRA